MMERALCIHKARRRRDRNEACDCAGDHAEHGGFLGNEPFREHPAERCGSGRDLRRGRRHAGIHICCDG